MRHVAVPAALAAVLVGCGRDAPEPVPVEPVTHAVRQWVKSIRDADPVRFCAWTFPSYDLSADIAHRLGVSPPDQPAPRPPWDARRDCVRDLLNDGELPVKIDRLVVKAIRSVRIGSEISSAHGISRTARVATRETIAEDPYAKTFAPTYLLIRYRGSWKVVFGVD